MQELVNEFERALLSLDENVWREAARHGDKIT